MREYNFNDAWKFWPEHDAFVLDWNIPDDARSITLPHDAMIEQTAYPASANGKNTGFRDGGNYIYEKEMEIPKAYKERTVMLKFEGVYMNAFVYVNGQLAEKNPYGYSIFYVELNNYLRYGEMNTIRVVVRAGAMPNSRWYSGAGIYRDVWLLEGGLTHMLPGGVQITTEHADKQKAVLSVRTEIKNRNHIPVELILETTLKDKSQQTVAQDKIPITLFEGECRTLNQRMTVAAPFLWSETTPYLYSCTSRLYIKTKKGSLLSVPDICQTENMIDENVESFGIRTVFVDAVNGLMVNGCSVKLRGACVHHDSGLLGAATYTSVHFRQIKMLKDAGFNAVRMAHHPMAPAMLKACDALGVYVMDEAFDMWTRCKSDFDYGLFFGEYWEKDITAMVRKDYNHPSVLLYSLGNEISEIGLDDGVKLCYELNARIKALDPTRYTLAAINGAFIAGDRMAEVAADISAELGAKGQDGGNVNDFMTLMHGHMGDIVRHDVMTEKLEKACAMTDIAGYNYMGMRYEQDCKNYPGRIIVGSETCAPEIAANWPLVEQYPQLIGDFTWTGWDYIGEAGGGIPAYAQGEGGFGAQFPAQLSYQGDIDITGFRRPASYFREIVFGLRKEPYIAVQNPGHYGKKVMLTPWIISDAIESWTWGGSEGARTIVEVYAPGDTVELFVNERSMGQKISGRKAGWRTLFETVYEPGTLTAVVYENHMEIGRTQLLTAESQRHLVVEPEEPVYVHGVMAPACQPMYISIKLCDASGTVATDDDQIITLSVDQNAVLMGFGSGNPKPEYNFNGNRTKTFNGRAMAVIQKKRSGETVSVAVEAENGLRASCIL